MIKATLKYMYVCIFTKYYKIKMYLQQYTSSYSVTMQEILAIEIEHPVHECPLVIPHQFFMKDFFFLSRVISLKINLSFLFFYNEVQHTLEFHVFVCKKKRFFITVSEKL